MPAIVELPEEVDTAWWRWSAHRIQSSSLMGLRYDSSAPLREDANEASAGASNQIQPDPHAFVAVVGRDELIQRLEQQVPCAWALGRPFPFPHMFFTGPAGMGKTTPAKATARRLGANARLLLVAGLATEVSSPFALVRACPHLGPHVPDSLSHGTLQHGG